MKIGAVRRLRLGGRAPGIWFKFMRMRFYRAGVPDGVVLGVPSPPTLSRPSTRLRIERDGRGG